MDVEIGDYRKPFGVELGDFANAWGECAEQVVKQISEWVEANRATILERRAARKR